MSRSSKRWRRARQLLTLAFFILVPMLVISLLRNLDWGEVHQALAAYRWQTLALAVLVSACSFVLFSCFDLLGRRYTGHSLPARQVLPLAFVCYAFNLNLSAWVGAIALRYRLYSRLGLALVTITRILGLGLVTNWLGYLCLAGALFASGLPRLPAGLDIGSTGLHLIGLLLLVAALAYLLACACARRRRWHLRGHEIILPSLPMAALQALMGAGNWALMALVMYSLLADKVDYPTILAVLLISSIAGVVTHIPAGLGVLETVFLTLLHASVGKGPLLAALIAYRVVYFLLPLMVAGVLYLLLERVASQRTGASRSGSAG
ncbi:lysylphosphatidylglycerol synthase domain-containing protein [Pseudomonas sp. BJa5]|uniref:lysylphosphatidylglycerol synthase domain-containing protein n=1 Tax=Pseudomonas sp. BJa5 TaxID=2936270 RepID=UPI00255966EE|nr:lysylphosphatidylglycerol synthase domain-containing protein [Pseudomonas sp. BGr12]MDL2422618.1 lysylphosphatidylglycerol synthase domain-containing protein [Pseudomonas sp. BGr12]